MKIKEKGHKGAGSGIAGTSTKIGATDNITILEPACKISLEDFNAGADGAWSLLQQEPPPGEIPPKEIIQALEENEDGDAALLVLLFKGKRLYDHSAGVDEAWYYWNDHHWREDKLLHIYRLTKEVVRQYYQERQRCCWKLNNLDNNKDLSADAMEKQKAILESQIKSLKVRETALQTLNRKNNVLKLAAMGVNSLGYIGEGWDSNPYLLGCRNGVIDLKTGTRRDGRPEDYIKTISPIAWEDGSTCPVWEKFLLEIFEEDQEMVDFLQRLLGYAISGLRTEHVFPIFWGERGRNGKGTIFETLKYILGEMAYKAPIDLLMQQNAVSASGGASANSGLMKFRGARIVWASESNKKDRLDSARIKEFSGGDTISARNPYGRKQIEFTPTHTLFMIVNPLPHVDSEDDALWQRVVLLPLNLSFVKVPDPKNPYDRLQDNTLERRLRNEAPGILSWLVEGYQMYQKDGLNIPDKARAATSKYRNAEDLIGSFIKDKCIVEMGNQNFRAKPQELYGVYKSWCIEAGYKSLNRKHFCESIRRTFGEEVKSNGVKTFRGITTLTGTV